MASLREVDRQIIADAWTSDAAYELVERLCACGSRFPGTPGEREAAELLVAQMNRWGLSNVRLEPFEYPGWTRGSCQLDIVAPEEHQLPAISLPHTGTFDVEAEVVDVGYGTPALFDSMAAEIAGRIVLVDAKSPAYFRRGIHRMEKYGRAVAAGAVGFIWMRDQAGHLVETGALRPGAEIPGVAVTREDGLRIRRLLRQGPVRVRIRTDNVIEQRTSWNVVGELEGRDRPGEVILVGAHVDGHDIAVGAQDDASGTAVVMEAARLLSRHREVLGRTVRFVCFGAEELGLFGSHAYVAQHADELDQLKFMLNLDGAGREGDKGLALQGCIELIPYFRRVAADMKEPLLVDSNFGLHSDMYPFSLAGVPSGYLAVMEEVRTGRNWGHTAADTLDKVSPRWLRLDSMLVARLVLRMACWPEWPGRRRTRDEVRDLMEQLGFLEVLKYTGRMPFSEEGGAKA